MLFRSPVTRPETIRMMLAVAAQRRWKIRQFDVKTAFLNGGREEELYMRQPEEFEDQTDHVCRLHCSINGLKQSSKCWFKCLTDFLEELGMKASTADPCIYFMKRGQQDEVDLVLCFHVDDGLLMGEEAKLEEFLQKLQARFEVTISKVDNYLGVEIKQTEDGAIQINQTAKVDSLLRQYEMTELIL